VLGTRWVYDTLQTAFCRLNHWSRLCFVQECLLVFNTGQLVLYLWKVFCIRLLFSSLIPVNPYWQMKWSWRVQISYYRCQYTLFLILKDKDTHADSLMYNTTLSPTVSWEMIKFMEVTTYVKCVGQWLICKNKSLCPIRAKFHVWSVWLEQWNDKVPIGWQQNGFHQLSWSTISLYECP
jgi:hypothetical protein